MPSASSPRDSEVLSDLLNGYAFSKLPVSYWGRGFLRLYVRRSADSLLFALPRILLAIQFCVLYFKSCSQASFLCMLTSHMRKFILKLLECTHGEPASEEVMCGWSTQRIGGAHEPVGRIHSWDIPSGLRAGFLMNSMKNLVRSTTLWCFQRTLIAVLPTSPHHLYSGWGEKEMSLFGSPCTAGEAGCSLTCSHLPLWQKPQAEKFSPGPGLYHRGWQRCR